MGGRIINLDEAPLYTDAGLKVGWAKHHLRILDEEIATYQREKSHTITAHDDLEAEEHVLEFASDPITAPMGLIVGDFAACLRGSLDHLAYALTLCKGGARNEKASFPVIAEWGTETKRGFYKCVKGIPAPAVRIIDSLQPYHSGKAYKATKLWRLHRLWNIDKHKRIPFHTSVAKINVRVPSDVQPLPSRTNDNGIMRFPLSAKGKVDFDPSVEVSINFGDASEGILIPYEELVEIYEFIGRDVIPRFKGFF